MWKGEQGGTRGERAAVPRGRARDSNTNMTSPYVVIVAPGPRTALVLHGERKFQHRITEATWERITLWVTLWRLWRQRELKGSCNRTDRQMAGTPPHGGTGTNSGETGKTGKHGANVVNPVRSPTTGYVMLQFQGLRPRLLAEGPAPRPRNSWPRNGSGDAGDERKVSDFTFMRTSTFRFL